MKYDLPAAELYFRSREKGEKYKDLGREFGVAATTISRRVRDFEDRLNGFDPKALEELRMAANEWAEKSAAIRRDPWYLRLWDWFRGRASR